MSPKIYSSKWKWRREAGIAHPRPKLMPKRCKMCEICPKCASNCPKWVPKCQKVQKLSNRCLKLPQMGPKIPKSPKIVSKRVQNYKNDIQVMYPTLGVENQQKIINQNLKMTSKPCIGVQGLDILVDVDGYWWILVAIDG